MQSPQDSPGFGGQRVSYMPQGGAIFVSGGAAAAIAAANALRTAWAGAAGPAAIGAPAPVNLGTGAVVEIFQIVVPDAKAFTGNFLAVEPNSAYAFAALQLSIQVSGWQAWPLNNFVPGVGFPLNLSAQPGETISVRAVCQDANAAFLLNLRIDGWTRSVHLGDDSLSSRVSRYNPGWAR
jgi:hypothetical protein